MSLYSGTRGRPACLVLLLLSLMLSGCGYWSAGAEAAPPPPLATAPDEPITPTVMPTGAPTPTPSTTSAVARSTTTATTTATATPAVATPFFQGTLSPACGKLLPLLAAPSDTVVEQLRPDTTALAQLQVILPEAAAPALQRLLDDPGTVGLVAYRAGQEDEGVFLNADVAMPLASVVKLIHLVAYVEAVAAGELDPLSRVSLEELEQYYLPNFDLNAHPRAVAELREAGIVWGEPPGIRLEDVPWMMVRHSSNAASDYLHLRLGQQMIEQTAVSLGLASQTAPCPFLGQFLAMANHTRQTSDTAAVRAYLNDPAKFGREAMLLTDAYVASDSFRQAEVEWRSRQRRPSIDTQRLFSHQLNPQGSARDYAALMARIAQNGLSHPESSFLARRYLEWPMRFEENQALFSNLGYKNGSLPGILTTVYYAYRSGETRPVVVALFFRDLPDQTYRQWRRTLPHDELARWLLADPAAIPALRAALTP